ncbi:hypothetical protein [Asticcacaulis sp. 201]|uniref:hypothetical protein n=1 Tax=Asticcacaulis sp. 201 TaxID=3028787 RepID=UPI0029168CD5|nr:hypothetical protein [Asticcacaulis sp. 201]MDV6330003.1 hypothetical protein [Asticcacaulis sp. 201]
MAIFHRFIQLIAVSSIIIGMTACSSPLDNPRRSELQNMAREASAKDMLLQGKVDLSLPAFLEIDIDGTGRNRVRLPACGGYCLRLLYSNEAKTVISGFAVPAPPLDCAPLVEARRNLRAGKIKELNFTPEESEQDAACEYIDKFLAGVTDADRPLIWRPDPNAAQRYLVWARAYHIEKRKSCPGTAHTDTLRSFYSGSENTGANADEAADKNIAAGLCLIETPVKLDASSAIFLFSSENKSIDDKKSPMRDTRFSSNQLTVYGAASMGRPVIYRHTISEYSYLPVLAPSESFDSATFFVSSVSEPVRLVDHVRSDIGLKLSDVPPAQVDYREAVKNALDNRDLDFMSPNWNVVREYLVALKAKGPNTLGRSDAQLIARLIADRRVTIQLRGLEDIIKNNPQAGPVLVRPLLTVLNASSPEADKLSDSEERKMISERGDEHRELYNAGGIKLDHVADGIAALDDNAIRTQLPLYRQLVGNQQHIRSHASIVEHLNLLPSAESLPILRNLITPLPAARTDRSFEGYGRLSALRAACRMGDDAAPLVPEVVRFLKSTYEPGNVGEHYADADIAWAILAHFHQSDALAAQLQPGKPDKALMASRSLNCH